MFIKNKYKKWYDSIIESASKDCRKKHNGIYYENHHIIPNSLGGSSCSDNMILLTTREHFVCHLLLTKFTTGNAKIKMMHAVSFFTTRNISSRQHAQACKLNSLSKTGKNNPQFGKVPWNKGKSGYLSKEALAKIEYGRQQWYNNGGMTSEYKNKISKALKGKPKPNGFGKQISEATKGSKHWAFKGYYHTPEGKLTSSTEIEDIIPNHLVRRWCKNPDKVISNNCFSQSKYLQSIGNVVGKTFREIGFYYEFL